MSEREYPRVPEAELSARIAQVHPAVDRAAPLLEALWDSLDEPTLAVGFIDRDAVLLWARARGDLEGRLGPGSDCAATLGAASTVQRPAVLGAAGHFDRGGEGCSWVGQTLLEGPARGCAVVLAGRGSEGHAALVRFAAGALARALAEPVPPGPVPGPEAVRGWLAEVVQQTPAALVVADTRTGRVVFANRNAEALFGAKLGEMGVYSIVSGPHFMPRRPDGRDLAFEEYPMVRALSRGETVQGEELLLRVPDGREVSVLLSCAPVRDDAGEILALVITLLDVTDRRAAEVERERLLGLERESRARAEEEVRLRERMMAVLGHDLRQPLTAVLLGLDGLATEESLALHRPALDRLQRSARRLDAMIGSVLDYGRTVSGALLPVEPRPADLRGIAEAVLEELRLVAPEAEVIVQASRDCTGTWDESRLEQLLTNLLANAVRYGDPRKPVTLRIAGEGDDLLIEVHNHGAPVPCALQEGFFKPFVRGVARGSGLGLGLYIVREIARAHGGSVSMRSSAEEGTTVAVRLPRRSAPA